MTFEYVNRQIKNISHLFFPKMEARLREINAQVEKMIVLLGGEIC